MSADWSAVAVPSAPRPVRPGVWVGPFGVFALLFGGIWAFVGWTVTIAFAAMGGGPWSDWILDRRGQAGHGQRATARTVDLDLMEKARQGEPLLVQCDPEAPERVRFEGRGTLVEPGAFR